MSVGPAGLDCITAHQIESDELEALVSVAHMRTHNLAENIRLATATRARTRAPEQFKFENDSVPSFQAMASSSPICWMFIGSSRTRYDLSTGAAAAQSEDRLPSLSRPSGF